MEHEFYTGLSIAAMAIYAIKKAGPGMAAWLDKQVAVSSRTFTFWLAITFTSAFTISKLILNSQPDVTLPSRLPRMQLLLS